MNKTIFRKNILWRPCAQEDEDPDSESREKFVGLQHFALYLESRVIFAKVRESPGSWK